MHVDECTPSAADLTALRDGLADYSFRLRSGADLTEADSLVASSRNGRLVLVSKADGIDLAVARLDALLGGDASTSVPR